jgi:ankyrin repeat protein
MSTRGWMIAVALTMTLACGGSKELQDLCAAVEAHNVDDVRRLLQQPGIDLNADQRTTGTHCRPFPQAMDAVVPEQLTDDRRAFEIVQLMLEHGADVNSCWLQASSQTRNNRRPSDSGYLCVIEYAARRQSPEMVRLALTRGANVKGAAGASALLEAALVGHLETVKMLVEAGAPVNETPAANGSKGTSLPALGGAVAEMHDDAIAYLEAQPGAREFATPSVMAGAASAVSNAVGQGGLTAREQTFMTAARHGDVAAVKSALSSGVQVDRIDDFGLTALMRAAAWGQTAAVDALLQAGATPSFMNGGKTALHLAAARGHVDVIRALVRAKADVNARFSATDETPLFAAVKAEQPESTRALIDLGADTTAGDGSMTALEYAIWRANVPLVHALLKGGRTAVNAHHPSKKESPLHGALWCKNRDYNIELIQTLVASGADLGAIDQNGDTPLKAVERKRAKETLPYYQTCYDAQLAALQAAGAR